MEPLRKTAPDLAGVQDELIQQEPIFHHPGQDTTRESIEAMTAGDFWETGASGKRYSRDFVVDTVLRRFSAPVEDPWKADDFFCQRLARDLYLFTYTLYQPNRTTRRMTLWRRKPDRWVAVYHQGTPVQP
jgi:hypothetical protein